VVYSWFPAGSNRESLGNDRGPPMPRNGDVIAAVSSEVIEIGCGSGISNATAPKRMWDRLETIAWGGERCPCA